MILPEEPLSEGILPEEVFPEVTLFEEPLSEGILPEVTLCQNNYGTGS